MDSSKAMVPKAKWSRKRINPFISFRLLHLCLFLSIGKISSPLSNMQRLQLSLEQKYNMDLCLYLNIGCSFRFDCKVILISPKVLGWLVSGTKLHHTSYL